MGADNAWWMDVLEKWARRPSMLTTSTSSGIPANSGPQRESARASPGRPVWGGPRAGASWNYDSSVSLDRSPAFYHEHRLPVDPKTYSRILDRVVGSVHSAELGVPASRVSWRWRIVRIRPTNRSPRRDEAKGEFEAAIGCAMQTTSRRSVTRSTLLCAAFAGTPGDSASFDCAARANWKHKRIGWPSWARRA